MRKLTVIIMILGFVSNARVHALTNPFTYTKNQIERAVRCRPTKPSPRCTQADKKFANKFWGGTISAGAMAILAGLGATAYVVQNQVEAARKKEAGETLREIVSNNQTNKEQIAEIQEQIKQEYDAITSLMTEKAKYNSDPNIDSGEKIIGLHYIEKQIEQTRANITALYAKLKMYNN